MLNMNSILTVEERHTLQSLGCKDKEQALSVLEEMKMLLPVRSDMFRTVVTLTYKLENEHIDYSYEMRTDSGVFEEE